MNIRHGKSLIQACFEYDKELCAYRFENDIQLGNWTVSKIIRVGGPKASVYKFDFKNYLEFVITHTNGESRSIQYYHNCVSDEITTTEKYDDDVSQRGVRLFLENHHVFNSEDWNDYDALSIVSSIKKIVASDKMTNPEKVNIIRDLLK